MFSDFQTGSSRFSYRSGFKLFVTGQFTLQQSSVCESHELLGFNRTGVDQELLTGLE